MWLLLSCDTMWPSVFCHVTRWSSRRRRWSNRSVLLKRNVAARWSCVGGRHWRWSDSVSRRSTRRRHGWSNRSASWGRRSCRTSKWWGSRRRRNNARNSGRRSQEQRDSRVLSSSNDESVRVRRTAAVNHIIPRCVSASQECLQRPVRRKCELRVLSASTHSRVSAVRIYRVSAVSIRWW